MPLKALNPYTTRIGFSTEFPEELQEIDHWVTFTAIKTIQTDRREDGKNTQMARIKLPLPAGLQTAYNISYSENALGALGALFVDALGEENANMPNRTAIGVAAVAMLSSAAGGALTGGLLGLGAKEGASLGMAGGLIAAGGRNETVRNVGLNMLMGESKIAQAAAAQFGIARNPHKVVLFDGVGFRKHNFSYQFTPKNRRESDALREIILRFKFHASPGLNPQVALPLARLGQIPLVGGLPDVALSGGKHFFTYPETFRIKFHHPEFLFTIADSVLTSVDVNYHGGGSVSYARGADDVYPAPTQVNLNLSFMETEIITKENLDREGR